jgi:lipopolysaccharide transport system ATP-binding protein
VSADQKSQVLVSVSQLTKRYPILRHGRDRMHALFNALLGKEAARHATVIEKISFDVLRGRSIGIIGENGAGKSTLLKLITGVLTPSEGEVKTQGSIGALLELGAGFHPEYSGRENARMSAALYGLSADALAEKMPEIEDFADIGQYLDEPVKHYSSGMVVRLGFAIIAAVKPDLIITDEVLAVGDESFQRKCARWIDNYVNQGGTLLLVSHSMYHVQKLCHEAIWLHKGVIEARGDVFDVTQRYLAWHEAKQAPQAVNDDDDQAGGASSIYAEKIITNGMEGNATVIIHMGDALMHDVIVRSDVDLSPVLMVGIVRADGTAVYGTSSEIDNMPPQKIASNRYRFRLEFDALNLLPGEYHLRTFSLGHDGMHLFDTQVRKLIIAGKTRELGLVRLSHQWKTLD